MACERAFPPVDAASASCARCRYHACPVPAVSFEFHTCVSAVAIASRERPVYRGVRRFFRDAGCTVGPLEVVVLLDEEPVGLALMRGLSTHAGERPIAVQFGAVQGELEAALAQALVHIDVRLPRALVPHHDGAAAVLAARNDALEAAVLHGVVFHLDREPAVVDVVAWTFRDRPAFQHTVPAEAKVVVQARGRMLLDDEGEGRDCLFCADAAAWLCREFEVAHGTVTGELSVYLVACVLRKRFELRRFLCTIVRIRRGGFCVGRACGRCGGCRRLACRHSASLKRFHEGL